MEIDPASRFFGSAGLAGTAAPCGVYVFAVSFTALHIDDCSLGLSVSPKTLMQAMRHVQAECRVADSVPGGAFYMTLNSGF